VQKGNVFHNEFQIKIVLLVLATCNSPNIKIHVTKPVSGRCRRKISHTLGKTRLQHQGEDTRKKHTEKRIFLLTTTVVVRVHRIFQRREEQ